MMVWWFSSCLNNLTALAVLVFCLFAFWVDCLAINKNVSFTMNFLETYGYLPKSDDKNGLNLLGREELRKAIILMQTYANIPRTGVIDRQTLQKIKSPRCGLPDVPPAHQKLRLRSKRFVIYGTKWTKSPITWSFVQSSRQVPSGTARQVFKRAFDLWSQASKSLNFIETSDPDADIRIGFYTGEHGCGKRQSFDGPGTKLAHAFGPPNGDVHFDDDEDWISEKDGLSLYWTALHEFGHSLGFSHTADESSIMFPYYQDHGVNFKLPEVDAAGIRYLYGDLDTKKEEKLPMPDNETTESSVTTVATNSENVACHTNIDAIASIRGDIFIFKNNTFWWIKRDLNLIREDPITISEYFVGFPTHITHVDAVYERRSDQKIMFFVGKYYWTFSANQYHDGPRPLTELGLPEELHKVDAVTNWGHNGRAYIFSGPIYWRLNEQENQVDIDYPRDMTVWKGVPLYIDAAFTWEFDSSTYFFKGNQYWKFDNSKMNTHQGFPKIIHRFWFRSISCTENNIEELNLNNHVVSARSHAPIKSVSLHFSYSLLVFNQLILCFWKNIA